jgi:hypothetical protein
VDAGWDTRHLYYVAYSSDPDPARAARVPLDIMQRLSGDPTVTAMTLVDRVPFTGTMTRPVQTDQASGGRIGVVSLINTVSESYFDTLGIPLRAGRAFTRDEARSGAHVAVVSANTARALWPGREPLGQPVRVPLAFGGTLTTFVVVGVAGDVRTTNISRVDPAIVYVPTSAAKEFVLLVRSPGDSRTVTTLVRSAVAAVDPRLVRSLEVSGIEDRFVRLQRLLPDTVNAFAAALALLALGLAAGGIYGVVSFLASQRAREIGIRMALGATRGGTVRLMLARGLTPVALGMAAGLAGALGLAFGLRATLTAPGAPDFLFGLGAFDPATFIGIGLFVAVVALAASAAPVLRAASISPLDVLRRP